VSLVKLRIMAHIVSSLITRFFVAEVLTYTLLFLVLVLTLHLTMYWCTLMCTCEREYKHILSLEICRCRYYSQIVTTRYVLTFTNRDNSLSKSDRLVQATV